MYAGEQTDMREQPVSPDYRLICAAPSVTAFYQQNKSTSSGELRFWCLVFARNKFQGYLLFLVHIHGVVVAVEHQEQIAFKHADGIYLFAVAVVDGQAVVAFIIGVCI